MSKLIFLAPRVWLPLKEGRKKFVDDLSDYIRSDNSNVDVVHGRPFSSPALAMLFSLIYLFYKLYTQRNDLPVVIIFPFGTFTGIRGAINSLFILLSKRIVRLFGGVSFPVFYSCDGMSIEEVYKEFGASLAVGRSSLGVGDLTLGVKEVTHSWMPGKQTLENVLFLCGYSTPKDEILNKVLHERGLIEVLNIGNRLADVNISLTIAVPLLSNNEMKNKLEKIIEEICPRLEFNILGEIDTDNIFDNHDLFVFPYVEDHSVFIPTSLLQAKLTGIPVIAADHDMYKSLTVESNCKLSYVYKPGDSQEFFEKILGVKNDYILAINESSNIALNVKKKWNLKNSKEELLAFIHKQKLNS